MKHTDMPDFAKLMAFFCGFYKEPMNELTVEVYWQAFVGFEFKAVKQAFYRHLSNPDTGQFMPKPADVVRCLNGDSETQALQAWGRVLRTLRDVGSYDSVVFDDALLHRVIDDMGGWIRLGECPVKTLDFMAREFRQRYAGYVLRPPTSYPSHLTGRFAWQNAQHGHEGRGVILVGDPEKATQVYQAGQLPSDPATLTRLFDHTPGSQPFSLPDVAVPEED